MGKTLLAYDDFYHLSVLEVGAEGRPLSQACLAVLCIETSCELVWMQLVGASVYVFLCPL